MRHCFFLCFVLGMACTPRAAAFETEPAVPLTVDAVLGTLAIERLAVRLSGREVEIATTLRNGGVSLHSAGFSARTPFFRQLGIAETHADKTFSSLTVAAGGKTVHAPGARRRGFFLGQDITPALQAAGIAPLPDRNVTEKKLARVRFPHGLKADDWEGYVSYSWAHQVAPGARVTSTMSYTALPRFGPEAVASEAFRQAVRAHCGDPLRLGARLGSDEFVFVETYELPIRHMQAHNVALTIVQPATSWAGMHPVQTLVCGLDAQPDGAGVAGTISGQQHLSVLVISRYPAQAGLAHGR